MQFWGDGKNQGAGIVREDRGNSLLEFADDYVVLDIETTGFDPWADEIIEIAAIKVRGNEEASRFETLVNPNRLLTDEIIELTGITDDLLADAPLFLDVRQEFLNFIGSDVLVGHNIAFDIGFLYEKCYEITNTGVTNDFIDTLRWSKRLLPDLEKHTLEDVSTYFQIKNPGAHRAMNDVLTTNLIYQELYKLEKGDPLEGDMQLGLF